MESPSCTLVVLSAIWYRVNSSVEFKGGTMLLKANAEIRFA